MFWRRVASLSPAVPLPRRDYLAGWATLAERLDGGASWSGHERNCCLLNLRDNRFVDVSAISGLDFRDDGRALAVCDWDGDGDLDLWFKNRTGPQLRFMRNQMGQRNHFISLKLVGVTCNRDAVGARVEVHAGGARFVRTVIAGDGYLAQSSKRLHFGLGSADHVDRVIVHWPDGRKQEIESPAVDRFHRIEQGVAPTESYAPKKSRRKPVVQTKPNTTESNTRRIVLRAPLPLPPSILEPLSQSPPRQATLITLWARWCAPCIVELRALARHRSALDRAGIAWAPLNVDKNEDRDSAKRLLQQILGRTMTYASPNQLAIMEAVVGNIRGRTIDNLSLPTSFLVDGDGAIQVAYFGLLSPQQLIADADRFVVSPLQPAARAAFAGRWFFKTPRDFKGLARTLEQRQLPFEAAFYHTLCNPRNHDRPERASHE